jgi:membrane protein DedA with SNARE-associated domain
MMMIETFVTRFGYLAVFLGTFLEGETFILIGGFFAHRGYLAFMSTVSVATLGAFSGDLFYFYLGRRHGRSLVERTRRGRALVPWLEQFMNRYHLLWIFGVRYLYGVRWLAAALAGSSKISSFRFAAVALPACFFWALVIACLGWAFGSAMESFLGNVQRYELWLLFLVLLIGASFGALSYWKERRLYRRE